MWNRSNEHKHNPWHSINVFVVVWNSASSQTHFIDGDSSYMHKADTRKALYISIITLISFCNNRYNSEIIRRQLAVSSRILFSALAVWTRCWRCISPMNRCTLLCRWKWLCPFCSKSTRFVHCVCVYVCGSHSIEIKAVRDRCDVGTLNSKTRQYVHCNNGTNKWRRANDEPHKHN